MPVEKYFRVTLPSDQSPRRLVHGIGFIDLEQLDMATAEQLWKSQWPFIELTEEGEKKYGSAGSAENPVRYSVDEVVGYIATCTCADEVNDWLKLMSGNSRVKKAATKRLNELR